MQIVKSAPPFKLEIMIRPFVLKYTEKIQKNSFTAKIVVDLPKDYP